MAPSSAVLPILASGARRAHKGGRLSLSPRLLHHAVGAFYDAQGGVRAIALAVVRLIARNHVSGV